MKKLFLLAIILIFTTGCSQSMSLFGSNNDGGDNIEDAMDEQVAEQEHEANMADDGNGGDNIDFDDLMGDIDAEQEHERNMADDNDNIDFDDLMGDIDAEQEHEANMADDGDSDVDDVKTPEEERRGGSCNAIAKTSTCIDYIGSFWTETQMRYSCSYSGTFSFDLCETGSIGGCNIGKGSFNDMIIWMYPYGGSPIAADTAKSAKPACDMNPMGTWVNAR